MKLIDFIICDDVRAEINNKVSIIGVYNNAINFIVPAKAANSWPKILRLGLFIRFDFDTDEEKNKINKLVLESRIDNEINFSAEQQLTGSERNNLPPERMTIPVVFNQFSVHKTGIMDFSLAVYNDKNELMEKFSYPGNIKINEIVQKN